MKKTFLGILAATALASTAAVSIFNRNITKNKSLDNVLVQEKNDAKGDGMIDPFIGKFPRPGVFYDIPSTANPTKIDTAYYFEKLGAGHVRPTGNKGLVAIQVLLGYLDTMRNDNVVAEEYDVVSEEAINVAGTPSASDFSQSPYTNNAFGALIYQAYVNRFGGDATNATPTVEQVKSLISYFISQNNVAANVTKYTGSYPEKMLSGTIARIKTAINEGRPVIINKDNLYVVAYGYDSEYVYVQDCNAHVKRLLWETFEVTETSSTTYIDVEIPHHEHSNNYFDLTTNSTICPCGYGNFGHHVDLYELLDSGESYGVGWRHVNQTQGNVNVDFRYKHASRELNDDTMIMYRSSLPDNNPEAIFTFDKVVTKVEFDYVPTYFGDQHVADSVVLKVSPILRQTNGEYVYVNETINTVSDSVFEPMHFSQTFDTGIVGFRLKIEQVDGMPNTDYHCSVSEMNIVYNNSSEPVTEFVTFIDDDDVVESETHGSLTNWNRKTLEYDTAKVEVLSNHVRSIDYDMSMMYESQSYKDTEVEFVFDREIYNVEFDNYGTFYADQFDFDKVELRMYYLRKNSSGNFEWMNPTSPISIGIDETHKIHHDIDCYEGTYGFKLVLDKKPNVTSASCDVSFKGFNVTHSVVKENLTNVGYESEINPSELYLEYPFGSGMGTQLATVGNLNTLNSYRGVRANAQNEMELFYNGGTTEARSEFFFDNEIIGLEFDMRYNSLADYYNRNKFKLEVYYWNYIDDDHGSWSKVYTVNVGNFDEAHHNTYVFGKNVTGVKFVLTSADSNNAIAGQVNVSNIKLVHSTEHHKIDLP